jgi:hypothetical protein
MSLCACMCVGLCGPLSSFHLVALCVTPTESNMLGLVQITPHHSTLLNFHLSSFCISLGICATCIFDCIAESEEGEGGGLFGSTRELADDGKRLDFLSPRGPLHT